MTKLDEKYMPEGWHTHMNKDTLDKITESGGLPQWDGGAWPGGGSTGTKWVELGANSLDSPVSSSWPVPVLAPVDIVGTLPVRVFDDTISEGVGIGPITVSGSIKLGIRWSAKTDPAATKGVVFVLYKAATLGAWDSGTTLTTAECSDGSENYDEWTIALAAGTYQFEIVRNPAAEPDNLVGDAQVSIVNMEAV